jgi:hypothetical protein
VTKANRPGTRVFETRTMREFLHVVGKLDGTPKKKDRKSKKRRQRRSR